VLDKEFLPGDSAIMVPQTEDGRVLFAVPWHDKVVVGTTDTPMDEPVLEPRPLPEEVDFILRHAARYLTKDPSLQDVRSMFAGLRPLVNSSSTKNTSEISRSHHLQVSESGLVTISGGKWTTYRKMAEDTIDKAALVAGLDVRKCITRNLRIHGWLKNINQDDHLYVYGSDLVNIQRLMDDNPGWKQLLHPELPYVKAEVVWAVRNEMARTVEDVLSRRLRALLLNARASMEMAPEVARLIAMERGLDEQWQTEQVNSYRELATGYLAAN
jgi:glycerol-3-phosphate dehydrogenase